MQGTNVNSGAAPLPLEPVVTLWRHRELFRRILVRDIQAAFRGSMLGLAWIVVIPLVLVAIYTFVFGVVLDTTWPIRPRSRLEVPLIYFSGIVVFSFFMEVITRAPNYVRDNKVYVTKIVFPVDILGWVLVGSALFKLCINLTLLLVGILLITGSLPVTALLLPVFMLPFALLAVGFAWMLTGIGAFVRDLSHALQALSPIILFVSPVFYPVMLVPEALRPFYFLNPLSFMLEAVRGALFFNEGVSPAAYLVFCVAAVAIFSLGYAFFQRVRPGFADVV